MYNQPDEYFIEAVSNASMNLFPENTLTRFTNRLQHSINLDGDWVVGIQEIFYPIDVTSSESDVYGDLLIGEEKKTFSVSLRETDDAQKFVNKINVQIEKIFRNEKEPQSDDNSRKKRSLEGEVDDSSGGLQIDQGSDTVSQTDSKKAKASTENLKTVVDHEKIIADKEKIIEDLNKEWKKRGEKIEKHLATIQNNEEKLKHLTESLDAEQKALIELKQKLENAQLDERKLTSEKNLLETTKQKLETDLATCQSTIELKKVEILQNNDSNKEDLKKLNTDLADATQKFETISNEKTIVDQKLKNANVELDELKDKLEIMKKSLTAQEIKFKKEIKDKLAKYGIEESEDQPIEQTKDKAPRFEYSNGKISIIRGWLNNRKIIPKFHDMSFVNALGFIDDPSKMLTSKPKVTAERAADLTLRSNLLFVYSDIVSPHFVGDRLTRVLRILPLKRGQRHELVHERFVKPFYYPVRSNKIEDVNFILTDEIGNSVKFGSGRVLVGLHLKRFV